LKRGHVYRCAICGSETLVIKAGKGTLRPVCCNQPQVLLKELAEMYRCPVCGSEVAVLVSKSDSMRLVCCNTPMLAIVAAAA
jgi:desulfoferrodoxin-like iron-binding protein